MKKHLGLMRPFERIPCCKRIEKDAVVVYTEKQSGGQFQKSIVFLRHWDSVVPYPVPFCFWGEVQNNAETQTI